MATWKKVIVSGSGANLTALQVDNLTTGQVVIGGGSSNLSTTAINGTGNIVATTAASGLVHSGSFSGSFQGDGSGLTGVTATAIFPTTAKTDLSSTDQFYINDGANKFITYGNLLTDLAGTNLTVEGTDSLTLASQISVTGITSSLFGTATSATTATNANNIAITNTTTGTGPYFPVFVDATTGYKAALVDGTTFTYNATTNTITATSSFATNSVSSSRAETVPYSGLIGIPTLVSASVLGAGSGQGALTLTTNGVSSGDVTATGLGTSGTPTFAGLTITNGNIAINNGTSTALTTTGTTAALFNTNATTLNIGGAATTLSIGAATGTTTVNNSVVITGDLTVNGTTVIIDTTNITVEDRFIMVNHGSGSVSPTQEGGIIVEGSTANSGSAFYYDGDVVNRWGVALGVAESAISVAANSYVVTVSSSAANPAGDPTYGGATYGYGNMYVNTSDQSIWIYS